MDLNMKTGISQFYLFYNTLSSGLFSNASALNMYLNTNKFSHPKYETA